MRRYRASLIVIFGILFIGTVSFVSRRDYTIDELRRLYSGDPTHWPQPDIDPDVKRNFKDIGRLESPEYPANNPYSKQKEQLGKILFFDPRLSLSRQIACASCHDPELAWGDGRHLAFGHDRQNGKRNAMTIINSAYYKHLFWDGRASSLEDQVQFPVQDKAEMAQSLDVMVANIKEIDAYKPYFQAAFGEEEVSKIKIQQAIATFERSVTSRNSRFDSFVAGKSTALSDDEVKGMHLFRTKARCINCHNTGLFSDNEFHNDGQTLYGTKMQDFGRYNVTHEKADIGAFRTPSLRETNNTGPWMHHGNFPTLKDVVEFYNLGNPSPIQKFVKIDDDTRPVTSPILRKLNLTVEEQQQIIAFLRSISTPVQKINAPVLPK